MPPDEENKKIGEENTPTAAKHGLLKSLRTYKSDALEAIKGRRQSLTQIVLAEQEKRRGEETIQRRKIQWNIVFAIASAILVVGGAGIAFFVFWRSGDEIPAPEVLPSQEIIFTEKQKTLELVRFTRGEIAEKMMQEILGAMMPINSIEGINFIEKTRAITANGEVLVERPVSLRELFSAPGTNVPQTLLRSLGNEFLVGIHSYVKNYPFLILTTASYENAFSGMLAWEKTMSEDIAPLFGSEELSPSTQDKNFKDAVVKNHDTRLVRDTSGKVILLYSFVDKKTLVITTNETTFDEILRRIFTPKKVQQ